MSSKVLKYLILLALALFIVAISSFWFSGPSFREGDVKLELSGSTQVTSGDEVTYTLKYANNTRSTLTNLDFVFFYPEGSVVLTDGKTTGESNIDFKVDQLSPGESGQKEFKAFVIGDKGSIKVAKATMAFKAGTLSSNFEKDASLSTTIINAPITLNLAVPPSAISGGTVQYILDYRNTTNEDASDLILEFDYPDGFNIRDFSPQPTTGNNTWHVDALKKGSAGRITINGTITGQEGENKVVSVKLKRKISDEYVDYQKTSAATVISNPVLGLDVSVNNFTDYVASLGDRLNYTVNYSNDSNVNFFGMNLTVKFEGDLFDFSSLDTRGGFYDSSTKTITWNTSVVPDFGNFTPGTKGKINFSVALKPSFSSNITGSANDKFVKVSVKLGTPNVPTGFDGSEVAVSSALITKITTDPSLNSFAYYNDSTFGSSGPFPMRVGEETYFTVHWQLTNPGNDINNVEVVAKLSPGVEWTNMTWTNNNLPAPTFNPNSNQVTWDLSKLPYGTGMATDKYEGSFRIKVKPTLQQKGSVIQLLDTVQFTGTDTFTSQNIIVTRKSLSSNEIQDRPREGTVQ